MEPAKTRTALLVGATGLVGRHCLDRLLAEPSYSRVVVLARRPLGRADPRLDERVVDFDALDAAQVAGDDVFCCLGTTIKVAGSQPAFRRVDHDYVVDVARLARSNGASTFALVSSVGADARSRNFYLRTKGEAERDVASLGYPTVELFRPSMLLGERSEKRAGEAVGKVVAGALAGAMLGPLRAYRPVNGATVAAAMVHAALRAEPGVHVREFDAIESLARGTTAPTS